MTGKILALIIIISAALAGAGMYYLQVYAFYDEVDLVTEGGDVEMVITTEDGVDPLAILDFKGIDADSSPIRFRACMQLGRLPEGIEPYNDAVPLTAPSWFDCFDARQIGLDLEAGAATAFLGEENVTYGIDRIVTIYPDGRAFAWHQINECGEVVFDGRTPPDDCPPIPEGTN